jgi:transcription-repair coupling factor (superfamily II helicase)
VAPLLESALRDPVERLANRLEELASGSIVLAETTSGGRPYLAARTLERLGGPALIVVPTPDVAEQTFADLTFYLAGRELALVRPRGESAGALDSPSDRSARMTLLADLAAGKPLIAVAPLAALRQYLMPLQAFRACVRTLRSGDEAGWEPLQRELFRLGYSRVDVVAAAGEFAVRGGIIDVFPASAETPIRIEFFGDAIESLRPFDLTTQRSAGTIDEAAIVPWSEIPREDELRARIARSIDSDAARHYLERGGDVPEAWVPFAFGERETLLDYLQPGALVVLEEPAMLETIEQALDDEIARETQTLLAATESGELSVDAGEVEEALLAEISAPRPSLASLAAGFRAHPVLVVPGGIEAPDSGWLPRAAETVAIETRPADRFNRQIALLIAAVQDLIARGESVALVTAGTTRLIELLKANGIETRDLPARLAAPLERGVYVGHGSIENGFSIPSLRLHVFGDREIFGQPPKRVKLRAVKEGVPVTLSDLRVGDYLVHAVHGIGQYLGLRTETIFDATSDYLDLKYAGTDRMLVPVTQMHQVAKYSAAEGAAPRLSKMGGADWSHQKHRVSEQLAKIADGLVELYADRELARGHAFGGDTPWQAELEEAFPYETTPDQQKAIDAAKADMEQPKPMDRLVCGDVGYGKTEVAVRACFKAIADKKQVAVLVPTTLLASQHYRTFSARFAPFPVRIEEISRFKTRKEQQAILRDVADGKVDLIVGTHRLLQKDVVFKDLGLIVVDEEQRFGVMHKERLKELRASVDVLTLSATPIPRTLQMSLLGVRDLSLIQTPPRNRLSIKTIVVPQSDAIVQKAILAELDRGGQVYYLHNRVETIYAVSNALQQLVPKARIGFGHGQMKEHELEPVMQSFIEGEIDILVATTIIENGIDIPNVNTLIVTDADKFGLGQLHQLRGRVGRSNHQAYAYLLYQAHKMLSEEAKARLESIREFTHLGAGFQLAMRDLEIRGAGNLLGAAQSGFIHSVGFETYCELLAQAIAEKKGQEREAGANREAVIDVKIDAFIPSDYIPQPSQKIAAYQQLAGARREEDVIEIAAGLRDRFGPLPKPLENLTEVMKLRTIALQKAVTRVVVDERRLTFGVGSGFAIDPGAIPKLQSLTKNRFRFGDGKITVDFPAAVKSPADALPLVRSLLEAL